ncbi:hypothetical protein XO10_07475 [Marinitoga sp. 1135]|uniref:hypothetical protein n=1 Tax=Marinitoga sp. 1135 TaxID=1643333 RepID=UPI0015866181|nr:hypothetical protein [Marinitoga sp. 1135]NUU96114.1 hypothetical protein [Marinitoga sp. 1135]
MIKQKNIKTLLAIVEAIDSDIVHLKINNNKQIIIKNPGKNFKDIKPGDYINILNNESEKKDIVQTREILKIDGKYIHFNLLNAKNNIDLILPDNSINNNTKKFLFWLGKFINTFNEEVYKSDENIQEKIVFNKSQKNFLMSFLKEIYNSLTNNKSLKIPDPVKSANIIKSLIITDLKEELKKSNTISKNNEQKHNSGVQDKIIQNSKIQSFENKGEQLNINKSKTIDNAGIKKEEDRKGNEDIKKENDILGEKKDIPILKNQTHNNIVKNAINAYQNFSNMKPEENFIFLSLFGFPIFFNIGNEFKIDEHTKNIVKVKRISFSILTRNFGNIKCIIYEINKSLNLSFEIEKENKKFSDKIETLIDEIRREGFTVGGLKITELKEDSNLSGDGLYG